MPNESRASSGPPCSDEGGELFLCLHRENNRTILSRELQSDYQVTTADAPPADPDFELCIVDEPALERHHEELRAVRQAAEPIVRPCLLLTSTDVADLDTAVWGFVDDVITTPVSMPALRPRIESLLRLHRLSVAQDERQQLEQVAGILSHDLRNPLNVAQGNLELARENGDDASFDRAAAALDRIEELLGDVLTLVRHEYSASDFDPVPVADLARDAWADVDSCGHTLEVAVDDDFSVRANRSALEELFANCYRNAREHNEMPVTTTVGSLPDGFYLADDGTGIPPADRDRVFEAGYSTQTEGTGLGLSIVDQIADAHGWEVVITESAGGGARVDVRGVALERSNSDSADEVS